MRWSCLLNLFFSFLLFSYFNNINFIFISFFSSLILSLTPLISPLWILLVSLVCERKRRKLRKWSKIFFFYPFLFSNKYICRRCWDGIFNHQSIESSIPSKDHQVFGVLWFCEWVKKYENEMKEKGVCLKEVWFKKSLFLFVDLFCCLLISSSFSSLLCHTEGFILLYHHQDGLQFNGFSKCIWREEKRRIDHKNIFTTFL